MTLPSLRDLHDPGIEPRSPVLQADSLPSEPPGKPHKTYMKMLTVSTAGSIDNSG